MPFRFPSNLARNRRRSMPLGIAGLVVATMFGCTANPASVASKPVQANIVVARKVTGPEGMQSSAREPKVDAIQQTAYVEESVQKTTPDVLEVIPHPPAPFAVVDYPALIYRYPCVAIAVPDKEAASGVGAVVLRKVNGTPDDCYVATVKRSRATFLNLSDGAYDVFYLANPPKNPSEELAHRQADRRVLIEYQTASDLQNLVSSIDEPMDELESEPGFVPFEKWMQESAISPKDQRTTLGTSVMVDAVDEQTEHAWQLFRKRSHYAALRYFHTAVHDVGKRLGALRPGDERLTSSEWQAMFDGQSQTPRLIHEGEQDPAEWADRLAAYVGNQRQMAWTLYGMAKTYDAISQSERPLISHPEGLAVICYMAAIALDPTDPHPVNDMGVLCYRLGWMQQARSALHYAAVQTENPTAAYNLGRVLWEIGSREEAERWWQQAIEWDPSYRAAYIELARCALRFDGVALYPDRCRQLASNLNKILELYDRQSPEWTWAASVLDRLQIVGRELRLNDPGLIHRHWYAQLGAEPEGEIQIARQEPVSKPEYPGTQTAPNLLLHEILSSPPDRFAPSKIRPMDQAAKEQKGRLQ